MDTHDMLPRKLDIGSDDIREGVVGIINLFMVEPQFQGQTKEKLNNPSARSLVSGVFRLELEQYLNRHPSTGEAIATTAVPIASTQARFPKLFVITQPSLSSPFHPVLPAVGCQA